METIERLKPTAEPRSDWFAARLQPNASAQDEPESVQTDGDVSAVKLIETESRIFQARLSYDPEDAEVFVEILDPTTGDVIRRLPAEKATEDAFDLKQGGALVNQFA